MPKSPEQLAEFIAKLVMEYDDVTAMLYDAYREGVNDGYNSKSITHRPEGSQYLKGRNVNTIPGGRGMVNE